jgi:hypothetical protein
MDLFLQNKFAVSCLCHVGEDSPIRYPSGAPARLTAVEITLQPGEQTGWHTHPVPVFGYILDGELTIDYGAKGQRTFVRARPSSRRWTRHMTAATRVGPR